MGATGTCPLTKLENENTLKHLKVYMYLHCLFFIKQVYFESTKEL